MKFSVFLCLTSDRNESHCLTQSSNVRFELCSEVLPVFLHKYWMLNTNINHRVIVTHSVLHHLNLSYICAVETHISEYLLFMNKTVGESGSVSSLLPSILEHLF